MPQITSQTRPWSIFTPTPSACGEDVGPVASFASRTSPDVAASRPFPPLDRAIVVSIACDVVARTGNPLSRQSTTDLANRVRRTSADKLTRQLLQRLNALMDNYMEHNNGQLPPVTPFLETMPIPDEPALQIAAQQNNADFVRYLTQMREGLSG